MRLEHFIAILLAIALALLLSAACAEETYFYDEGGDYLGSAFTPDTFNYAAPRYAPAPVYPQPQQQRFVVPDTLGTPEQSLYDYVRGGRDD